MRNLTDGNNIGASRGFTLVEMIVAVALFSIVMLVAVGALLSLSGANRKAQALQSVMNNLNIALDGMVRNIRMGSAYHCGVEGSAITFQGNGTDDCILGGTIFAFEPFGSGAPYGTGDTNTPWVYQFGCPTALTSDNTCPSGGYIERSEQGGISGSWERITAPEVNVQSMTFYVVGTNMSDSIQPKVLIVIEGTAGALGGRVETTFHIQATAVQRALDLPQH